MGVCGPNPSEPVSAAGDFFASAMVTALPAGACLTSVRFPVWRGRIGTGFHEVSARKSDFAFAAAAAQVELADDGRCKRIAIGVGATTDCPIRLTAAETQLAGSGLEPAKVRSAVADAFAGIETLSDLHASADYRRRAAIALATRAIADAATSAKGH